MNRHPQKKPADTLIVNNKKALHDYYIENPLEAGIVLEGWEVKSIRKGQVQIRDSHIIIRQNEAWIVGMVITPLPTTSAHTSPDPQRTRKILLHREQIEKFIGQVERKGYTLVPLALYYSRGKIKLKMGLGKGKKAYDKRDALKEREWEREKQRINKYRG